eukprot:1152047-Pelagomonas_calceolata.AAC.1
MAEILLLTYHCSTFQEQLTSCCRLRTTSRTPPAILWPMLNYAASWTRPQGVRRGDCWTPPSASPVCTGQHWWAKASTGMHRSAQLCTSASYGDEDLLWICKGHGGPMHSIACRCAYHPGIRCCQPTSLVYGLYGTGAGAILQSRIARLVYGAPQPRLGADGSWVSLFPASTTSASSSSSSSSSSPHPASSAQQQQQQQQHPDDYMLSSSSSSSLVPSASQQTLRPPSSTFPTNIGGPAGASDLIGRSEATDVCGRSDKTKCMGTGGSQGKSGLTDVSGPAHVCGPVCCNDSDVEPAEKFQQSQCANGLQGVCEVKAWLHSNTSMHVGRNTHGVVENDGSQRASGLQGVCEARLHSNNTGMHEAWLHSNNTGMHAGRSTHGAVGNDGGGVLGVCEASMPDGAPNGSPRSQAADKPLLTAASGPLLTEPKNKHVQTVIVAHATLMADNSGIQAVQEPTTVQRSHHSEGAQRAPAVANAAPAATATAATVAAAPPPHPFHNQIQVLRGVLKEECAQVCICAVCVVCVLSPAFASCLWLYFELAGQWKKVRKAETFVAYGHCLRCQNRSMQNMKSRKNEGLGENSCAQSSMQLQRWCV